MKTSAAGQDLIKEFESCRLQAYPDPKTGGPPWTCGWGETAGVTSTTCWSQEYADQRLVASLSQREAVVSSYITRPTTQGQFDAFVSILYNVGFGGPNKNGIFRLKNGNPSTLVRKFNAGDIAGAEVAWMTWVSPGSSVENGLRRRRATELELFKS